MLVEPAGWITPLLSPIPERWLAGCWSRRDIPDEEDSAWKPAYPPTVQQLSVTVVTLTVRVLPSVVLPVLLASMGLVVAVPVRDSALRVFEPPAVNDATMLAVPAGAFAR